MSDTDTTDPARSDHLETLRGKIENLESSIQDADLKRRMRTWERESYEIPSGSVEAHVNRRIAEMEAEYKMRNHDDVASPTDAFPDGCEGCPHYGGGCPIVTFPTPQDDLERITARAESAEAYKQQVRQLARDYDCHRLPEFITEFDTMYADKIEQGHALLDEAGVELFDADPTGPKPRVDPTAIGSDGDERGES